MVKKLTAALLFLLFGTCAVHAQASQPEALKNYLALTNFFLQDGGKWIRPNKDVISGDTASASHYAIEFYRGINENTIQLKLKSYLPMLSEWKMIGELLLSWDAKKQKAVLYGAGSDGILMTGESDLVSATELRLVSSSVSAKGIAKESKEVFRFKEGKIEINSLSKINNAWKAATPLAFTKLEQPSGNLIFMSGRDGNFEIYSMDTKGENLKNLSCNKAVDYAFSSFNNRLLFYSNRDGNDEIYIQEADGRKLTNLTNNPASDRIASFSPDGSKIVFVSNRDQKSVEIYVMDTTGKNLVRLTDNEYFEDAGGFSPDGKKIIFSRELRDLKDTSRNAVGNGEIFIMDADGKNEVQLTNKPGFDGGHKFRPMENKLCFMVRAKKGSTIFF